MAKNRAECIRQVANWSHIYPEHKFDKHTFLPNKLKEFLPVASPKLDALFAKIKELDAEDMMRDGKRYKHMIFSDVKTMGYGAKIIMAAFLAKGYHAAYDKKFVIDEQNLQQTKYKNVALLCSTPVYDKPIGVRFRKHLLETFNKRPDNIYGENIRFIILDQGFKEGIDLFDLKYVHLFEPLLTNADEKQAIGRGTRYCGQKGLHFQPNKGWQLQVYKYEISLDDRIKNIVNTDAMFPLYLKYSNIDLRKLRLAKELDNLIKDTAVDAELTKAVHEFSINNKREKTKTVDVNEIEISEKKKINNTKKVATIGGGIKGNKNREQRAQRPKPPSSKKSFDDMKNYINERFSQYKWEEVKLENLCGYEGIDNNKNVATNEKEKRVIKTAGGEDIGGAGPEIVNFTPTQDFVRQYFQPASIYKGLLLAHSVGTGKTCTAIATATTSWEPREYTILWVTRHTLKADIWKNMYKQVCSLVIKNQLKRNEIQIPENAVHTPMKYLSKVWMKPISFKQFSNMCKGKNDIYREMVKRNGAEDPLKKTLIIIDEVHKIYAKDVVGSERPDPEAIKKAIHESYEKSGDDSVRVLLMSATPYTDDPLDMMRILNLIRKPTEQLPENIDKFTEEYLDDDGSFTELGKKKFQNDITGLISYLNRERDARQFAYPIFHNINVPISTSTRFIKEHELSLKEQEFDKLQKDVKEGANALKEATKKIKQEKKLKLEKCKTVPRKDKAACKEKIEEEMKTFERKLLFELENKVNKDKPIVDAMKKEIGNIKKELKTNKTDGSQEYELFTRCISKKKMINKNEDEI